MPSHDGYQPLGGEDLSPSIFRRIHPLAAAGLGALALGVTLATVQRAARSVTPGLPLHLRGHHGAPAVTPHHMKGHVVDCADPMFTKNTLRVIDGLCFYLLIL